jgi:Putative auto-transporter adhesin, head GIN domain
MRKLAVILILVPVVAAGCHYHMHSGISGSGKRALQKRDVASFSSISTQGAFDIEVVCQKPVSLEIEGDDNVLPLVTTEVSNNVLYIKNTQSYSVHDPISLRISVPNLEAATVSGAGKLNISGVKNEKFELDSSGAPTIRVSGDTKVVDIDTSGAAKIDTHRLHASQAVVDSKGVSKVELAASDTLNVTISGPSHVTYEGDPVVNKTIHGPGSVDKKTTSEGS